MQPRSPRVVELLNDALTTELTAVNTYFLHSRLLENWGFPRLGRAFYNLSIGEMKDADALIQRILLFDGHPNVQRLRPISAGEDAQEVLDLGLAAELAAIDQYDSAATECRALGDNGTAAMFDAMVLDEQGHADWFEAQLAAVKSVGIVQFMAQQVDAQEGPS